MELEKAIEGILFYKGEPVSKEELAALLDTNTEALATALIALRASLDTRGIRLIETEREVTLGTAPELSERIEALRKEELSRDIGKAGAETLAIILYKGPVTRTEIDFIRGVNSSFILRNLLIRGLIERESNPKDIRSFRYRTSIQLLSHMGVTRKEDLPNYEKILGTLDTFERENRTTTEQPHLTEKTL